jgi:hypothetical protein
LLEPPELSEPFLEPPELSEPLERLLGISKSGKSSPPGWFPPEGSPFLSILERFLVELEALELEVKEEPGMRTPCALVLLLLFRLAGRSTSEPPVFLAKLLLFLVAILSPF